METTTTRIADLPATNNMPSENGMDEQPTNYTPMNVHPNPYGPQNSDQHIMDRPQVTQQDPSIQFQSDNMVSRPPPPQTQYLSEEQQLELASMKQNRLPSRDIQQDTTSYSQDAQVQPNYIPRQELLTDYVRDRETFSNETLKNHENKMRNMSRLDVIISEIQVPIMIVLMYFFFQLPIMNTILFKKFSFLSIYNDDGNFNLFGLMFKSLLFGTTYYTMIKTAQFLTEI